MRFGSTLRGGPGVGEEARESELAGFDLVGSADTQSLLPDVYCSLTQVALRTERVTVAPWVTNVSTRLPVVTAGAIATIDQVSGGRALLAIGTGRSSTANAGLRAATPDELAKAITTIASAFRPNTGAREDIEWPRGLQVDERVVALPGWATRRVPIY
ncbi:MAG: LLM class flavin-dependent oxidoreductase, partial [Rhodococcus fascians]